MSSSQAPTMQDLLKKVTQDSDLKIGDQIKGEIIFLAKNQCLIDIANVGLGVIRGKELYNEEYLARLKIGEEVEAIIVELDNELGLVELSFRAIGRDKIWEEIQKAHEDKSIVQARIRDANRGGFLVKVKGVDGFLPASLLAPTHAIKNASIEDNSLLNQMKKYVGQIFNVKIINVDQENETLILSEKAVSEEIAQLKLAKFKIGDLVEGEVVGVVDFGVFVRFEDDLEGLIHISELAWKKVEDTKKEFHIGQKVKAKIVEIDGENRINLSIKQLQENPWTNFSQTAKPGDKFVGTIAKIVTYGAIVVNKDEIQGLCHISQISEEQLDSPAKIYELLNIGETREFSVLEVENGERLYLTLLPLKKAQQIYKKIKVEELEKLQAQTEAASKEEDSTSETLAE